MENSNALNNANVAGSAAPRPGQHGPDSGTMLSRDVSPVNSATTMVRAKGDPQERTVVQRVVTDASETSEASVSPNKDVADPRTFIVDGVARQCESLRSLLDEPQLLYKFRDSFSLYFSEPLPDNDALKQLLLTRQDMKNAFLLVNNIEEYSGNPVPAASPKSTLYNPDKACLADRTLSLTCHMASAHAEFLSEFPCREVNVMTIANAGFYLSVAEKKLICHSCGGSINGWQSQWQKKSLNEVHAKLFPACSFLKAEFGQAFIDRSQRSVASGLEDAPRLLADYPSFYAVPPGKAAVEAEREARDYLALLFRLSHPVSSGEKSKASLLPSFEFRVDLCRQRLDDTLNNPAIKAFFVQLSRSIKELPGNRLAVTMDLLQLLQDLLLKPAGIMSGIASTIVSTGAWRRGSPSERIREIKSMMVFVHCQEKMAAEGSGTDLRQLLTTLKTFFNESVLFKAMYSIRVLERSSITATWSFDTRHWLQRRLSTLDCDFPTSDLDTEGQVNEPPSRILAQLTKSFRMGISNQADFIDYLVKTVKGDSRFLLLLRDYIGQDSNGIQLLLTETERSGKNLEHILSENVRKYWDDIMRATTKQQTTSTASQGGE